MSRKKLISQTGDPLRDDGPEAVRNVIGFASPRAAGLNPMDGLDSNSISFVSNCDALGQVLLPTDKIAGGDPFFELSARNLVTLLTATRIARGSSFTIDVTGQLFVIEAQARRRKPKIPFRGDPGAADV